MKRFQVVLKAGVLIAGLAVISSMTGCAGNPDTAAADRYITVVKKFADLVLERGRDVYGPKQTPLLVDGVNVDTFEPVKFPMQDGSEWIISNLGNQQNLFRTLAGLTNLTQDPKYKQAAIDATTYTMTELWWDGLLPWGGHTAYNASDDVVTFGEGKGLVHELKCHFPYYDLLWEIDPDKTKTLIEKIWAGHIRDWSTLDFNRHGLPVSLGKLWDNEFGGGPVFFDGKGLSFRNAGSDLVYAAGWLHGKTADQRPLVWAKRMVERYNQTRNPATGLGGYQFTQDRMAWCDDKGDIRGDRAEFQFAAAFPGHHVVEGTVWPNGNSNTPMTEAPLMQLCLGESLGDAGQDFIRWALEDLTAWATSGYRWETNEFIPQLTDGTSLEGFAIPKEGYFGPKGRVIRAGKAGSDEFWVYLMAHRIGADPLHWKMARNIAQHNGWGDIGESAQAEPALSPAIDTSDPRVLFALLELHRITGKAACLEAAKQIAENILRDRYSNGFFVESKDHLYAKFDRVEPLALLHLAARLKGTPDLVPVYNGGSGFFDGGYVRESRLYSRKRGEEKLRR